MGADPLGRPPTPADLSVVIPVHDAGPYLAPCLESLRGEPSPELEILLIDDGSTDQAVDQALATSRLPHEQVVRVIRQPNRGAAAARNLGLRLARGTFVCLLDADDFFEAGALAAMWAAAGRSDSDLVLGRSTLLDETTGARTPFPDSALWDLLLAGRAEVTVPPDEAPLLYLLSPSPCPRLVRRTCVEASGIEFPEGVRYGEDLAPHIAWIGSSRRVHLLDRLLFVYRQKPAASGTTTAAGDAQEALASLGAAFAAARRLGLSPRSGAYVTYRLLARYAWQALQQGPLRLDAFLERGCELFAAVPAPWCEAFQRHLAPNRQLLELTTGRVLFDHDPRHDYGILLRALRRGDAAYLREAFSSGPTLRRSLIALGRDAAWGELARRALAPWWRDDAAARRRSRRVPG